MTNESKLPRDVNVLLVTVTEVEGRAVLEEVKSQVSKDLPQGATSPKTIEFGNNTYFDLGSIGGKRTFMVQSEMGAGGPSGSAATVTEAIEVLSPSAVIMVGIAFGVDEQKQRIGNILVSRQLELYELQRVGSGSTGELQIILRGDRPSASPRLLNMFRASHLKWPESAPKVKFGQLLSGAKLIDNQDFRDQLQSFAPEAIGGEMEGEGIYAAAHRAKVDWIVVKAICDWADGKKNEDKAERQKEAAKNSTRFVMHTLRQGGFYRRNKDNFEFTGKDKIAFCNHLGDSWQNLATYFEIPIYVQSRFRQGEEAREIWAWLQNRQKLAELPEALEYIERSDLAAMLMGY